MFFTKIFKLLFLSIISTPVTNSNAEVVEHNEYSNVSQLAYTYPEPSIGIDGENFGTFEITNSKGFFVKGVQDGKEKKTLLFFNLSDETKNDMLTGDIEYINVKYTTCKSRLGPFFGKSWCLYKGSTKYLDVYSDDIHYYDEKEYSFDDYPSVKGIGRVSDYKFCTTLEIGFNCDLFVTSSSDKKKIKNYEYYVSTDYDLAMETVILTGGYIRNTGEYVEVPCTGSTCYVDSPTEVLTGIDKLIDEVLKFMDFIKNNWPLILLFIFMLIVGIWVTPLMNLIKGVIKVVIKILDYAWTTIVNACIGIHNIWFWLWTRDDYKRKQKIKSYRKYD